MENWQRCVINKNLPQLIEDTICHPTLLARLLARDIISKEEKNQIDVTLNPTHKADYLYKILVTRPNAYHSLIHACKETKQSGVVSILEDGESRHNSAEAEDCINKDIYQLSLENSSSSSDTTTNQVVGDIKPEVEHSQQNADHQNELLKALEECNVSQFTPKTATSISNDSFESFEQAISEYVEVEKFKEAFEKYQIDFPSSIWGPKNETLLHVASAYGYISLIEFLIEQGISVTEEDTMERTPGHYVGKFSTNIIETTKVLIKHGLNVCLVDKDRVNMAGSLVNYGVINGLHYHHWVDYMIKNGLGDLFAQYFTGGATVLHYVLKRLDLDKTTIENILKWQEGNINSEDSDRLTALHVALMHGRSVETIKSLVDLGADIQMETYFWGGVLHFAVRGGNKDVIPFLLSLKTDINKKVGNHDDAALHHIVFTRNRNYFEMTKFLLQNGANLYLKTGEGYTIAHVFSLEDGVTNEEFRVWAVTMIKNGFGKLFSVREKRERSVLHTLMQKRDLDKETLQLIIKVAKLDINQADSWSNTILHLALSSGRNFSTIKTLMDLGADWKLKGQWDRSVMHFAVERHNKEAVLYFESLGADINAKDAFGETPLHLINLEKSDYVEMAIFLSENGADLLTKDNKGRSWEQQVLGRPDGKKTYRETDDQVVKLREEGLFRK